MRVDCNGGKITRKRAIELGDLEGEEIKGRYTDKIFELLARNYNQGYYASMAAAWLTAESFVTFPGASWSFLSGEARSKMDNTTYNMAIRKIRESRNPSAEVKERVKNLKK